MKKEIPKRSWDEVLLCALAFLMLFSLFFTLALLPGCHEGVQTPDAVFNARLHADSSVPWSLYQLTDFEWSAVCVLPQYLELTALSKQYSFLGHPEQSGFELSPRAQRYVQRQRPLLLFFNAASNQYIPIMLTDDLVRNGMPWYLEANLPHVGLKQILQAEHPSAQVTGACLQQADAPTLRFIKAPGVGSDMNKVFRYLILEKNH